MFIKRFSYKIIPSLYKIWYGDDYLIRRTKNAYAIKTNYITGGISKTILNSSQEREINNRIQLDFHNAHHYDCI